MRILILFLILGSSFGEWDEEDDDYNYEYLRDEEYYDDPEYDYYNPLDLNISEEAVGTFSFMLFIIIKITFLHNLKLA